MDYRLALWLWNPQYQYRGVPGNNETNWDSELVWLSPEPPPTHFELVTVWNNYLQENGDPIVEEIRSQLWQEANDFALEHMDTNARDKYLIMLQDSRVPQDKKDMIWEMLDWADTVWAAYKVASDTLDAGNLSVQLPDLCGAPYGFWEIVL